MRKVGNILYPDTGYERIVFTNGCFDIIHLGHIRLLQRCKDLAGPRGAVVVGMNSDESVRRLKGLGRPIIDETSRGTVLISLRYVDHVISFEEDTPRQLLETLRPHIIVKGGDYRKEDVVGNDLAMVEIVSLVDGYSTTKIIESIYP